MNHKIEYLKNKIKNLEDENNNISKVWRLNSQLYKNDFITIDRVKANQKMIDNDQRVIELKESLRLELFERVGELESELKKFKECNFTLRVQ